jgi:copper resistance protein C
VLDVVTRMGRYMRSGNRPRSLRRLVAAAVAAFRFAIPLADPALAHAALVSSKPGDGATVTAAPSHVELTFDENILRPSTVIVTASDGKRIEAGPTQILNATVTQPLGVVSIAGWYTVVYRVVSADGHPISGQLSFMYAPRGGTWAAARSPAPPRSSGSQSAHSGHGTHLVALGILVAAALTASLIALRKGREYDPPTAEGAGDGRRVRRRMRRNR